MPAVAVGEGVGEKARDRDVSRPGGLHGPATPLPAVRPGTAPTLLQKDRMRGGVTPDRALCGY